MKTAILLAMMCLTGCASFSTLMRDPNGHVISCASTGIGIIGIPAAAMSRSTCVEDAKRLGYYEML